MQNYFIKIENHLKSLNDGEIQKHMQSTYREVILFWNKRINGKNYSYASKVSKVDIIKLIAAPAVAKSIVAFSLKIINPGNRGSLIFFPSIQCTKSARQG